MNKSEVGEDRSKHGQKLKCCNNVLLFLGSLASLLVLFASSVLRSLPGHAQTRTSKHLRPKTIPLGRRRRRRGLSWKNQGTLKNKNTHITQIISYPLPRRSLTHSGVSRVKMVRMGRRFMPPMHELLHIKLRRMVVISEPS